MTGTPEVRKLAAIMFTDIQGYTAIVQQDEAEALRKVAVHRQHLEQFTAAHQGTVIEFYGDGSLSIYDSVVDAVRCAIAMQQEYKRKNIPVRIGIHLGDFVRKDGTILGDAVNIASRIQAEGIPGGILISEKVQREMENHSDINTVFLGRYRLRNVKDLVRIYAIKTPGISVPRKKGNIRNRAKRSRAFVIPLIAIAVTFLVVRYFSQGQLTEGTLQEERIAIPEFTDLTARPQYGVISKMAAHWITTELIESVHASVVSYQSAVENTQVSYASSSPQAFSNHTGAVNIINGYYQLVGDSLEFSATILNLKTGLHLDIRPPLPKPRCPSSDPMDCIQELANGIKGYWRSRSDHVLNAPTFDAYKAYLDARAIWLEDPDEAKTFLDQSISLDPDFIDAYFLTLDWYYNHREYEEAANLLKTIRSRFTDLTERQRNYLRYHEADNAGRNVEAFNYFLNEYQIDPKDLFVNTSGMVMSIEYVNDPAKAIELFLEIDPDSLDLQRCVYCQDRFSFAVQAYNAMGKTRKARNLAEHLSEYVRGAHNYQKLIEFYVASGDTAKANMILREAMDAVPAPYKPYLYLIAGKQAQLKKNNALRDYYAQLSAQYSSDSSRALARSLYLRDDLTGALEVYQHALARDSSDSRIYGEMGVIYARQGLRDMAERMSEILSSLKQPFDYGNTAYVQGRIAANLGDRDRALELLETSLAEGNKFFASVTYTQDTDLMMLFDDSRFRSLLKRI